MTQRTSPPDPSVAARAAAYDAYVAALAGRSPPVRIVPKAGDRVQALADRGLRLLSLGRQDRYLTEYVTTLGHTIYTPTSWEHRDPGERLVVLRHELVHVAQFERYGAARMTLLYTFGPLPMGLSYARARIELEAYRETLLATAEVFGLEAALAPALEDFVVARFTGPDYLYMWPFPGQVRSWLRATHDEVRRRAARGLQTPVP